MNPNHMNPNQTNQNQMNQIQTNQDHMNQSQTKQNQTSQSLTNTEQKSNECNVKIDVPYPPIQTQSRKKDYAYAMLSNIGCSNSEMSAVSLYFYNSVILEPDYEKFAKCFHKISIDEMHHLHIFASLAFQMGLDPRLWCMQNRRRAYWTPDYNSYPQQVRAVIENSIKGELDAIHKYTRQAETICDEDIVKILNRIILDEEHHIELFHTMLDCL